jgi:hypothetical protein
VLIDGVDNGWRPEPISTAVLGGLAAGISDLREKCPEVRAIVFIRDNMFRALAHFDGDHARHLQGSTLRLHWDEHSLFHMVSQRIRVALGQTEVESDIRVWNAFAQRDLRDRIGFNKCLQNTLYRPRDVITLMNDAYTVARRAGHDVIIGADLESSATAISDGRLLDLLKEYETVLPGLRGFVDAFKCLPAIQPYAAVIASLTTAIAREDYYDKASKDFAIFSTADEAFRALYGVGFLGLRDLTGGGYRFCHDGTANAVDGVESETSIAIHPCYWRALNATGESLSEEIMLDIYDDDTRPTADIKDMRFKRLGQIVEELPKVARGAQGSQIFFDWCIRALRLLFAGDLGSLDAISPGYDIKATNMAEQGFWSTLRKSTNAHRVVFIVRNESDLEASLSERIVDYRDMGLTPLPVVCVIYRPEQEGLDLESRRLIRDVYASAKCIVFPLPATLIGRCMAKQRSKVRDDYTGKQLRKKLATVLRIAGADVRMNPPEEHTDP